MRVDRALAAVALAVAAGTTTAAPPAALLAACNACHGPNGNSQIPSTPSLARQPKVFLETQLVLVREGLREVPVMKQIMAGLTDPDLIALAEHYAAQPLSPMPVVANPARLRRGAELSRQALCGTCHLKDYAGQQQVPRLAGQNEVYLLQSMQLLRDNPGPGRDTIMASTLRGLTDDDLAALANYLASARL